MHSQAAGEVVGLRTLSTPPLMPIAPSLQQFVDEELVASAPLIERVTVDALALLRDLSAVASVTERSMQADLADRLQRHAAPYQRAFVESLQSRVLAELARDVGGGEGMAPPSGLGELSLMDESRVEIDIEISRATQLIDAAAEWELRELQAFTSTLVGRTHVSADTHPLRPMFYATALWDAASAVYPGQAARALLLRTSSMACAPLLKRAWAAASTRLEARGVTPSAYRTRVQPAAPPSLASGSGPGVADLPHLVGHLLQAMPAGGEVRLRVGVIGAPPGEGPAAATALSPAFDTAWSALDDSVRHLAPEVLTRAEAAALAARLDSHRAALAASVATARERKTIALVSCLFDAVVTDSELPAAWIPPVARLQLSALRVALRDPLPLDSARHPLWLLLDRLGLAAASYSQPSDPRGAALLTLGTRLVDELTRHRAVDTELYRRGLARLEEFLEAQMQAQLKSAANRIAALRQAERLDAKERDMADRLIEQMAPLRPSPAVRRFMSGPWARVLAAAILEHGEDAEPSHSYIRLVDDLLWSVQSPDHPASRQRLAALLPGLLRSLRAGMASIALPDAEQRAILAELLALHTAALRRGDDGVAADRIVRQMREEPAPHGDPSDPDPMIDVASLQTVPAELLPAEADSPGTDSSSRLVAALQLGERRRMFVNGRWARVQLLWRSDSGQFFLFAGDTAAQTHSITRRALERLALAGLLRPLENKPLSQRALDAVNRRVATEAVQTSS